MKFLLIGLLGCSVTLNIYQYYHRKKAYKAVDGMFNNILNEETIIISDLKEGRISALASKAKIISNKLSTEIAKANHEKEEVKSLISNMSHQLKTPLATIMMSEEILSSETLSEELKKSYLKKIRNQSEKLSWILQSLFKMTKLEQNVIKFEAKETFIRSTILSSINSVFEKAEKRKIRIVVNEFEDCKVYHNEKWTCEVFVNLLENAIKYTKPMGEIIIGVNQFEFYTEIYFKDNGIGIKPQEYVNIFKRFYRSRDAENIEGSGIGLYLSKIIIENEKGYINVKSQYGKGSCFSVFLQKCKN